MAEQPVPREFLFSTDLEDMTGIAASTWRFWATTGEGPPSQMLGRRRVWRKSDVDAWLIEQARKQAEQTEQKAGA
jgi:predicted DNA-binding transcriptional regulator AlpA